jgi:hypothetical protein
MQIKFIPPSSAQPPGFLGKVLALIATVVLAVILVVGAIGFAYLWWKTRAVRRQLREMQEFARNAQAQAEVSRGEVYKGEIIEGEAVRVHETDVRIGR